MPDTLESKDTEHLQAPQPIYCTSGERFGQLDRWGQDPAVLLTFRTAGKWYSASASGTYLSSMTSFSEDSLVLELEHWRDASADTFWMIEESLENE